MSVVNILRGLPCRLESLRLKFTHEPSIFVDWDLAESIKRSASDRLGDLVPWVRLRTFQDFSRHLASRHIKYNKILSTSSPVKILRDEIRVTVIIDTRANCIAKKWAKKIPEDVEIEPQKQGTKTWKFRYLPLCAKDTTLNHCVPRDLWLEHAKKCKKVELLNFLGKNLAP